MKYMFSFTTNNRQNQNYKITGLRILEMIKILIRYLIGTLLGFRQARWVATPIYLNWSQGIKT